jgi:D-alanine-D-alanine ligase
MKKRLRVGILFGGRSGEHEVSLISAASILRAIDRKKYDVIPIGITKDGHWLPAAESQHLLEGAATPLALSASSTAAGSTSNGHDLLKQPADLTGKLDVIFPVLHGTFGEDGTIQGMLELADIPYVGSGVLGSAASMDKDVMKRLFSTAGLPQTPWIALTRTQWRTDPRHCTKKIEAALKYPLFVKPANLGSSVGISKVHDRSELAAAMDLAASYDRKLVIEQGVGGPGAKPRELEVAVLGNDAPTSSLVGEIIPDREFYDYASKYDPTSTSIPEIPAQLTAAQAKQIRSMAIAAFRACDCAGLARVDFLMEPTPPPTKSKTKSKPKEPAIYLNEINTMPGFTSISMYPKLWAATGLPYKDLIDRLISLALERHREKQQTQFSKN